MSRFLCFGFCICFFAVSQLAHSAKRLGVGFYILNGHHRAAIVEQMDHFRVAHPDIELDLQLYHGEEYGDRVDQWMAESVGPDLFYWHGGQQVKYYSDQGMLQEINSFWEKNQLDNFFSSAGRSAVEFDNNIYGVPVSEQLWGLFYRASSMQKHGIVVPKTWDELLAGCAKAMETGANLFAFGSQTPWMTHAWFDYLNMRINGIEYHKRLLDGKVSFLDKGVKKTMLHWKELLDRGCFNNNFDEFSKDSAFPLMFHDRAFMMLTFSRARIPGKFDNDFEFAPFPVIDPAIPQYTVSPVEVFIVPAYAKWRPELEKMLKFLSSPKFQQGYNGANRLTPAHNLAEPPADKLTRMQADFLRDSPGGIQYFDRDTRFDFARYTPAIFVDFMRNRNVDRCMKRLENLRKKVFLGMPVIKKSNKDIGNKNASSTRIGKENS